MSIGLIVSPATWLNGTVASPTWFQTVQDNFNGLINGTGPTLKALQIDGGGGSSSSVTPGTLVVSQTITANATAVGTVAPTPTTIPGTIYKELVPIAWARINHAAGVATLSSGVNISAVVHVGGAGSGQSQITLRTNPTNDVLIAAVSAEQGSSFPIGANWSPSGGGPTLIRVFTYTSNTGAAIDNGYTIIVFGY